MGDSVTLRAADGHLFGAYIAQPASEPSAGLVVIQEIFGVNAHIRSVADGWARDGFLAIAPALFDRISPGIELGYDPAAMQTAMSLFPKFDVDKAIVDIAAAVDYAASATHKKVGVIGYCLGGSFVPPQPARELRELTRRRTHPRGGRNRVINRIIRRLEDSRRQAQLGPERRRRPKRQSDSERHRPRPNRSGGPGDVYFQLCEHSSAEFELALEDRYSDHVRWLLTRSA